MPAPLMIFRLLKKMLVPGLMTPFQPLKKFPGSYSGAPEETEETRATASVAPDENQPDSSAPPAPTPTPILPSASDVKKTKAADRAAVKKRKASSASESSAPKKMTQVTSSFANPIDVVPISTMPSKDLVPFGEDYE